MRRNIKIADSREGFEAWRRERLDEILALAATKGIALDRDGSAQISDPATNLSFRLLRPGSYRPDSDPVYSGNLKCGTQSNGAASACGFRGKSLAFDCPAAKVVGEFEAARAAVQAARDRGKALADRKARVKAEIETMLAARYPAGGWILSGNSMGGWVVEIETAPGKVRIEVGTIDARPVTPVRVTLYPIPAVGQSIDSALDAFVVAAESIKRAG